MGPEVSRRKNREKKVDHITIETVSQQIFEWRCFEMCLQRTTHSDLSAACQRLAVLPKWVATNAQAAETLYLGGKRFSSYFPYTCEIFLARSLRPQRYLTSDIALYAWEYGLLSKQRSSLNR